LASGALVAAIRWREPARLVVAVILIGIMGVTVAMLSAPTLNYYRAYGTNEQAARRLVTESELYGLKLSRMLTPQGGHRFSVFSDIGAEAQDKSSVRSEGGQALGVLGVAGFLGALWGAFAGRWRRDRPDVRPGWDRSALREDATTFTLLALLFGTIGGLSILVSMAGFSQIRVWNRIVLIIAFFAMVIVLMWSEQLTAWIRGRSKRPQAVLGVLAVAVLAFGLWDSIPPQRISYEEIEAQHASDRAFLAEIEQVMPDGAKVLQLPIIEFPEAQPVGKMEDYDHLRAYLADDGSLQWSYGSIKGRPDAAWQTVLRDQVGPIGALPAILGLGFEGIWIDTYGYAGKQDEVDQIVEAVGVEPMVSSDGRFLFLDLRDFKRRTGLSDEELRGAATDLLGATPPEEPS
jgi:phosphoglycerol transferase